MNRSLWGGLLCSKGNWHRRLQSLDFILQVEEGAAENFEQGNGPEKEEPAGPVSAPARLLPHPLREEKLLMGP